MSREIVKSLQASVDRGHAMIDKFIEKCPTELWESVHGGYPVWQQIYHLLACVEFFVATPEDFPKHQIYPVEVLKFDFFSGKAMTKAEAVKYSDTMKEVFAEYIMKLDDEKIMLICEGASQRMQTELRHIDVIQYAASHVFYHLGMGDAILGESGLNGVYGMS